MQGVFFFYRIGSVLHKKGSNKFGNEHLVSCIDGLGYIFFFAMKPGMIFKLSWLAANVFEINLFHTNYQTEPLKVSSWMFFCFNKTLLGLNFTDKESSKSNGYPFICVFLGVTETDWFTTRLSTTRGGKYCWATYRLLVINHASQNYWNGAPWYKNHAVNLSKYRITFLAFIYPSIQAFRKSSHSRALLPRSKVTCYHELKPVYPDSCWDSGSLSVVDVITFRAHAIIH